MIKWIKYIWSYKVVDVSKHRMYTTRYEDLCM
jgi:hypothetical protein